MKAEIHKVRKKLATLLAKGDLDSMGVEGLQLIGIAAILNSKHPDMVAMVKEFHKKFNLGYYGPPRTLPKELDYRILHLQEELDELKKAYKNKDIEAQFDALIDIIYLGIGTLDLLGMPTHEGFTEVHESNMTKEAVPVGMGKWGTTISKGKNYKQPNLKRLLPASLP